MPRKDNKQSRDRKRHDDGSEDDSSVDDHGNIRNLIDYDYTESSSEEELFKMDEASPPPRKAKVNAKKKMRRLADLPSESSESRSNKKAPKKVQKLQKPQKPVLVVESVDSEESDDDIVLPKSRPAKKVSKKRVVESESEEEEEAPRRRAPKSKKSKKRHVETESEEEEDSADFTTESSEDMEGETDSEDEEDEEEEAPQKKRSGGIDIVISDLFGGGGGGRDPNKPHKYNMKKEPANVRRFVELVQKEDEEEDTIDNDITYFKSLDNDKQSVLIKALELKASPAEVQVPLKFKILEKVSAKPDLTRIAMSKYNALCNIEPSSTEYYKVNHWINGFTGMPLGVYKNLPVKMEDGAEKCNEFMTKVQKCLETAIYGHDEPKLQIMQFVSSWIANPKACGNVLSVHGPPGVGKTSLIKDGVAKALDRPFHFISLGGATDASFLDGHSYTYEGSTWGKIVDVLIQSKCMKPIIYFDELDKISQTPKGDEIMNILIHLTDGAQNDRFQDKYFTGVDLDLSRCLFIFSHNNNDLVNPILRDRMYNIAVKGFSIKEKLVIAENYLLVSALKDAGLHEKVSIGKEILQHVIENFTGGEPGVRELKRCIQTIVSKINLLRFYNDAKKVPFAIENFALPFTLKKSHVDIFLKRKEENDPSIAHLYT